MHIYIDMDRKETSRQLHDLLLQRGYTVATAESCTAGNVSALIAATPGSSEYFRGGVVAYDARIKSSVLGVPMDVITEKGIVSSEVAQAMAQGVARLMNTDCAIATTGVAGPGNQGEIAQGTVWTAAVSKQKTVSRLVHIDGDRDTVMTEAANFAAKLLVELLKG